MGRRALDPSEVEAIGLPTPQPQRRAVSAQEAAAIGLPEQQEASFGQAAARGFAQGATMGWADEAEGWLESKFPRLGLSPGDFIDPRVPTPQPKSYEEARNAQRALDKTTRESRPEVYIPAEIAGSIAGSKGLGAAGAGYKGAVLGGVISGAGASEAESAGGIAGDSVIGAGAGVVGQYLGDKVARTVPALARSAQERLKGFAAEKALKAAGYIQKDLKPMIRRDPSSVQRAGEVLLEEPGVITPGATVEQISERLGSRLDSYGDQIGRARQQADALGARFDIEPFLQRVETEILQPIAGDPAVRREAGELARLIRGYRLLAARNGGLGFEEANALKTRLQKTINFGNHFATGGPAENGERFVRQMQHNFAEELERQLAMVLNDGAMASYRDAMARYGPIREAIDKSRQGIAREGGNASFGLRDYLAGIGGSAIAGPAGAVVAPVVNKVVRERGDSALAVGARNLSRSAGLEQLARIDPNAFGPWAGAVASAAARGPDALRTLDKVLRDTSPQWRALREQQERAAAQSQP